MKLAHRFLVAASKLSLVLSSIWFMSSCTMAKEKNFTLDELKRLDKLDRIEITHRHNFSSDSYPLKTIDNPKQIELIVQAFHTYADNWQSYHPYAPPGLLYIEFYNNNERQLTLMIGYTDNTSSGNLFYHLSKGFGPGRPLKEQEFKELMKLLDIEESLAYYH